MRTVFHHTEFSEEDIRSFRPEMKIGLIATVTPRGLPHVTLISTLMASDSKKLVFGQFTEGLSKKHIQQNPKAGFMVMSLDKDEWRGKAIFTHTAKDGRDYDFYNNVPMFRYNSYFGVHTVYYMDLVSQTGKSPLPMKGIIFAAVKTMLARTLGQKTRAASVINTWSRAFVDKMDNLKFLCYLGADGYPLIIPAIQTQSLGGNHLLFSTSVYRQELDAIPAGVPMAVLSLALTMEDVLLRGAFQGIRRVGGVRAGVVEVDWIYNPMPPAPGQVYPPVPLKSVTEF